LRVAVLSRGGVADDRALAVLEGYPAESCYQACSALAPEPAPAASSSTRWPMAPARVRLA
jgi:hypothetical protein